MRGSAFWRTSLAALAFVPWLGGTAIAQSVPSDYRTYFTFSGPVAIPGVTLPAGKYLFRLADTSGRDIMQVLSADGKTPYAAFFFHRAERPDPPTKPEIRFMETGAGVPAAVRSWWYPGNRTGWELVYPRDQAERLAKGTGTPVLMAKATPAAGTPPLATVKPTGEEAPVAEPAAPAAPAGRALTGEIAPSSVSVAEPTLEARAALPQTGSSVPMMALLGLTLLLGAALARTWRRALR